MQDSYRELFLSESQEYLSIVSNCLVKLEDNPSNLDSLNEIFRCMHTLKGMSATMGFEKLTQISHQMESLLDELRSQKIKINSEIIDTLFATVDVLEQLTEEIRQKKESKIDISACLKDIKAILETKGKMAEAGEQKEAVSGQKPQDQSQSLDSMAFSEAETARIQEALECALQVFKVQVTVSRDCIMKEARAFLVINNMLKIGEIVRSVPSLTLVKEGKFTSSFEFVLITRENAEYVRKQLLMISELDKVEVAAFEVPAAALETISAKEPLEDKTPVGKEEHAKSAGVSTQTQAATKTANLQGVGGLIKKIQSMRIPVERLDKIMNLMGELAIAKIRLVQITQSYSNIDALESVSVVLDRLISSLQDEIMQTRLLPASYILDTFPRMVRDLARKQQKEIDFHIEGGEIELDRVALDEISDPLVHLIRNAIDHGIELPQERKAAGKNPSGSLAIKVSRQKGQIFIEIIDDGRGVDFESVKTIALTKGLITKDETGMLDEKRVLDLITLPGFSTAKKVTDISGRGVGLDVVKSKIEALGGRLEFETKLKVGSRFILTLPLTLAIIKAMLVRVGDEIFAIPLMSVREIIKLNESELKVIQRFEVARIRDEIIPIVRLNQELEIPLSSETQKTTADDRISVIIIEYGKKALGLVVHQVLGEQDIVVKPLGTIVKRTKGIAGATILGDGKVALILDTMSLK